MLAISLLVIVALAVIAVVVVLDDGDPTSDPPDNAPAAFWWVPRFHPEAQFEQRQALHPDDGTFVIEIHPVHCWLDERSPVERIDVEETAETVTITAYVERSPENGPDCDTSHRERVTLSEALGERTLLVGGGEEVVEAQLVPDGVRVEDRPQPFRDEATPSGG